MLPYGMVHYHGAPADLRDIPIGTLHAWAPCHLQGEEETIPKPAEDQLKRHPHRAWAGSDAILLEDDVSFY